MRLNDSLRLSINNKTMIWETAAREAREGIERAIPSKWRLQEGQKEGLKDFTQVPVTCGLLSEKDIEITELDASSLTRKLASGELSATSVTEAFCGRAAIAHQLVGQATICGKTSITFQPCLGELFDGILSRRGTPESGGIGRPSEAYWRTCRPFAWTSHRCQGKCLCRTG